MFRKYLIIAYRHCFLWMLLDCMIKSNYIGFRTDCLRLYCSYRSDRTIAAVAAVSSEAIKDDIECRRVVFENVNEKLVL